ncbi:MAG: efflux transporter outer membrane subunit [Planctomycetaceae bacterium]|nr:efflux transporter outer membrane subunit [Planctomycetaceae bacterium]
MTRTHYHVVRKSHPGLPGFMMGRGTLFLLLLVLPLFVGCTSWREYVANGFKVGPNYCRPAAPVADQWLDEGNPAINSSPIQNAAWWQTFNDPVLDSLAFTAYQQNLSLRVAGFRILEARAQRAIAAGELFPQGQQAFGEYSRTNLSKNGPSGASPALNFDDWTLGGSLSWELDFWGQFRRAIEAADAHLDSSIENYDYVLVLLLSQVAQSYADVRIAEQRLEYARQNVDIQRGSLRIAEDRFRQGSTTRLDVTQAISNLEQTEASIRPLEAARRQAVNQLCILMGVPPRNLDEALANHHGIPKAPGQVALGIPAELLRRRPDVRRAERDVAAQSALIGVAAADLYPHFSINGTIFLDSMKAENLFNANSFAGNVGPSFRWNILNYGRLVNGIRVQEARFQQLAVQYQNTVLQANAEAENSIIAFIKAQQQVQSLGKSVDASRESVELVSAQYREGTVDFNRVFNVQQSLTQQEDQLAVAEGSVAQFLIQLYRALGGGWEIRLAGGPQPLGPTPAAAPAQRPADHGPATEPPQPPPAPLPPPTNHR